MTISADIQAPDVPGNTVSSNAYVYVIAAERDAVKIGVAKDVHRRIKKLQTGHFRKLSVFCEIPFNSRAEAFAIECRTHRLLKTELMKGEWFSVSPERAKLAIEQAIADWREECRLEAERAKEVRPPYKPPFVVQVVGCEADELSAYDIAIEEAPEEKHVVVLFYDRAIFVGHGANNMCIVNDVTQWYMPGQSSDGKAQAA